jgi:hypothetical protein
MSAQLAARELQKDLIAEGTKHVSPKARHALSSLVAAPTSKLQEVDCASIDAYNSLMTTFTSLEGNLTKHNASISAENAKLKEAYDEAHSAWLEAESQFRSEEAAAKSAADAAVYAKGEYDKYASAKSAGQAEYDQTIAPLNEEKDELTKTIPILEMIDKMVQEILAEQVAAAGKAKGVQQLALKSVPKAKLSALRELVNKVVVPHDFKQAAKDVAAMRVMLQEEGAHLDKHMVLKIPGKIIGSMQKRLEEIEETRSKMDADLAEDDRLFKEWETKLVDMSDAKDAAHNAAQTADLIREEKAGINEVKEASYVNYNAGYVVEEENLSRQKGAIAAISAKLQEAIAQCSEAA